MSKEFSAQGQWNQRCNAPEASPVHSESMFQLLFERSADAIWLFDPRDAVFVDCNDAAVALMRSGTKDKLLRTHPAELSPPVQPDGRSSRDAAGAITALVEKNGAYRFEWVARRMDGTDVPLEIIATAIQAQGRSLHVVVSRDISERQRAEAALRESEEILSSVTNNIAEAVFRTGPEHQLIFVNRTYLEMFGFASIEDAQALPRERLCACAADRSRFLDQLERVGCCTMELEFVRRDGTHFWGLASSIAIRDPRTGAVSFHVGTITDVTARKRAEDEILQLNATLERRVVERTAELAASEARARTLIENAPEAIVVLDGDTGRFMLSNENATRLYGRTREQLLEVHPSDVSPEFQPDGRPSLEAAREWIQKALDGETPVFEWTHTHSSGRLLECEVRLVRLPSEGRKLVRGSVTDNTERKRRERIQQATYQISEAVHTADDLPSFYARVHAIVQTLMPAKNFYVAVLDPVTELISFPYFVDEQADELPQPRPIGTGLTGVVLRTGKPQLIGRALAAQAQRVAEALLIEGLEVPYIEAGVRAAVWLGVPLTSHGRAFGVMAVQDYHEESAYGENEKQILTFVAAQTALAIERKRAEQALVRRAELIRRHRNALLELALLDKSDFGSALEMICARTAVAMNVARVGYWTLQEDQTALACELLYLLERKSIDASFNGTRVQAKSCPNYFRALATKEPLVANRVDSHPDTRELMDGYLRPLGITSMLDVPVWLNGKLVGVLCQEHVGEPREWTAEEIDFAASVANMVSLGLEAAQRAHSEQALRESEQKFRALFESSSQGVMLHDEEKFLEVNPATLRILGFDRPEEMLGKHPKDTAPPNQPDGEPSAAAARRHISECMEKGSARFDWMSLNAHGEPVPVEVILTRVELGGRRIIQAVMNDISERKKAEAELRASEARLRESEARFSAAFHASPVCITIARVSDGQFVEANEAFLQWLGFGRDKVVGRTSIELGLWADSDERASFWRELEERRCVRHRECQLRDRRGAIRVMLLSADTIEINKQPHVLTVGLDISDRKNAEAELLRALGREKELGQLKSNFVSMVSHEFRTPLGIIMSSAEILKDYLEQLESDERQHHLGSIAKNTKRMAELMEEVLVLGRLDAGKMDFKPAPMDLRTFSARLVDEVLAATERRCPIQFACGPLPSDSEADERLLRHIFTNLLSNAIKYSEPGTPVEFGIERDGREAVCRIHDRGIGIPEEDQQWLFNAFHRGRNVGLRPGTGLGLVIVKRCVELHGGNIRVESKSGEGTMVTVRLPVCSAAS